MRAQIGALFIRPDGTFGIEVRTRFGGYVWALREGLTERAALDFLAAAVRSMGDARYRVGVPDAGPVYTVDEVLALAPRWDRSLVAAMPAGKSIGSVHRIS